MKTWQNQWAATLACVVLLCGCVALSHPVADIGIADDFSYILSAQVLARTGHVVYNGWSTAMLGWQLYWGALFLKLLGDTFFAIRLSGLVLAALTTALLHRTLLRCGLTPRNAVLGTLAVVLSPLFLPLAYSFMSDVPGLLALLVSVYCCVRALEAFRDDASSGVLLGWLLAATVGDVVLGTTRQIAWVGVLVLVPTAAWMMRRRRLVLAGGAALWLAGAIAIVALLHWFQKQPYSLRESFFGQAVTWPDVRHFVESIFNTALELPLLVLPLALGFLFYVPWSRRRTRIAGIVFAVAAIAYAGLRTHQHILRESLQPTLQGVLSDRGMWFIPVAFEWRPIILSFGVRMVLSVAALVATFAVLAVILGRRDRRVREDVLLELSPRALPLRTLLVLLGPCLVAYTVLLLSRAMFTLVYDRYLLLLMVAFALFGLRWTQHFPRHRLQQRAQWLAAGLIAVFAGYGVLAMHDLFAVYRARLTAIDHLRALGVPRTAIRGELEYDSLTEIGITGHVNEGRINPPGAFQNIKSPDWRLIMFPHVYPYYGVPIVTERESCRSLQPVVPVHNLLGPHLAIATTSVDSAHWAAPPQPCP